MPNFNVLPLHHWVKSCRLAAFVYDEVSKMSVEDCLCFFDKDARYSRWAKDVILKAQTCVEFYGHRGYKVMRIDGKLRMVGVLRGGDREFLTCLIK